MTRRRAQRPLPPLDLVLRLAEALRAPHDDTGLTIGSMCTGYGGLDMAALTVLGGRLAWVADPAPGPSAILAHRYPGVPNLGDLRAAAWEEAEPVDVVAAGVPCQPVSLAGKKEGMNDDRWLWDDFEHALSRMARPPRAVFVENVRGLLTANKGGAISRVLHGLSRLGYVGRYRVVFASEVLAPHERPRVFIWAWRPDDWRADPADPRRGRWVEGPRLRASGPAGIGGRRPCDDCCPADAAAARLGWHEGIAAAEGQQRRPDAAERGLSAAADAGGGRRAGRPQRASEGRETARRDRPRCGCRVDWREYADAVRRWEPVVGRPVPYPLTEGARGALVLDPRLPEWMQGLPDGWVSDVPGLTRNDKLTAIGNGVCPLQAAYALLGLLYG